MTIYVDFDMNPPGGVFMTSPFSVVPLYPTCHMMTDTHLSELHVIGSVLGCKYHQFHDHPTLPHYDLNRRQRTKAIRLGAKVVNPVKLERLCVRQPNANI